MKYLLFICTFLISYPAITQQSPSEDKRLQTIEGITDLMLEILSGPQGEERDWELYKSLFASGANMNIVRSGAPAGKQIMTIPIDEFVTNYSEPYSRDGFLEYATGLHINEFNGVANAFQSFYCKNLIGTYENKGINTYQLVFAGDRWWITNVAFANETDNSKVPEQYLDK